MAPRASAKAPLAKTSLLSGAIHAEVERDRALKAAGGLNCPSKGAVPIGAAFRGSRVQ